MDGYCWPKHHIGASGVVSFLGSGSQKYCTIRLHFSRSTPVMATLSVSVASEESVVGEGEREVSNAGRFTRRGDDAGMQIYI